MEVHEVKQDCLDLAKEPRRLGVLTEYSRITPTQQSIDSSISNVIGTGVETP
jgi:hypothetical protein